jgi:hypothetical protein
MKLYKFYENGAKQVFGAFAENKSQFFYSGFESAEEAKSMVIKAYVEGRLETGKPTSVIKAEVERMFVGDWSEIY